MIHGTRFSDPQEEPIDLCLPCARQVVGLGYTNAVGIPEETPYECSCCGEFIFAEEPEEEPYEDSFNFIEPDYFMEPDDEIIGDDEWQQAQDAWERSHGY